ISFLGEKAPDEGLATIANYHGLALPTHGENFGHAIVEMLSCGRPVLISDKTPWVDLGENQAGYSIALEAEQWTTTIEKMLDWDQSKFDVTCKAALAYYRSKFEHDQLVGKYLVLFGD
ncbi:MAG TPA: hypothetical protein VG737_02705, partial [Cyclobacteriaceae bacterium]|nr:hypothetical protein [Cyclobacteriaceae bacterium]